MTPTGSTSMSDPSSSLTIPSHQQQQHQQQQQYLSHLHPAMPHFPPYGHSLPEAIPAASAPSTSSTASAAAAAAAASTFVASSMSMKDFVDVDGNLMEKPVGNPFRISNGANEQYFGGHVPALPPQHVQHQLQQHQQHQQLQQQHGHQIEFQLLKPSISTNEASMEVDYECQGKR